MQHPICSSSNVLGLLHYRSECQVVPEFSACFQSHRVSSQTIYGIQWRWVGWGRGETCSLWNQGGVKIIWLNALLKMLQFNGSTKLKCKVSPFIAKWVNECNCKLMEVKDSQFYRHTNCETRRLKDWDCSKTLRLISVQSQNCTKIPWYNVPSSYNYLYVGFDL